MASSKRPSKAKPASNRARKSRPGRQKPAKPSARGEAALLRTAGRESHPEFELRDEVVERALRTGEHPGLLEDYFGPEKYAELRQLARDAPRGAFAVGRRSSSSPASWARRSGPAHAPRVFDDVYWFDPVDIAAGHLTAAGARSRCAARFQPLGVMLHRVPLKLKLRCKSRLRRRVSTPFDWRQSIADLGQASLRSRLEASGRQGERGGSQHGRPRRALGASATERSAAG